MRVHLLIQTRGSDKRTRAAAPRRRGSGARTEHFAPSETYRAAVVSDNLRP